MNKNIQILTAEHNDLIGNLIHELDKNILTYYNNVLKEYLITFQQAIIILTIYASQEEIYQKNIEKKMGLTNPSVTSLIQNMISKDLVYKIQSKKDARYFHLHLTPKSLSMVDEIANKIIDANNTLLSPLTEEEAITLQNLLCKLTQRYEH